jgi:hypothetical protein
MSIEPCGGKRDDGLTRGQKHVVLVVLQKAFKYSKMRGEARRRAVAVTSCPWGDRLG